MVSLYSPARKTSRFLAQPPPRRAFGGGWLLGAVAAAGLLSAQAQAQTVTYSAPIVITQGGTYTGNYQSSSSSVPCVRIATTQAVVLDGCNLTGAGNLIEGGTGTNLTVRNCRGQGLAPSVDNQAPGRFFEIYQAQRLVIEHNYLAQTSGMVVNRWSGTGQTGQTLTVRYNQARNIDGRWRNAGGGTHSSFLLLNTVQHLAGVEIAYNEVVNAPDQSLVEDNINFYNSSGTAASPLRVHDNFVRGAYPYPATATGFTGSGLTTDGNATTAAEAASYIEADHNQFVGTGNAAMNLAAGHDVYYHDNRAVTAGTLPDGRRWAAGWAGLGVFNYYNQPAGVFGNNRVENNTIGYVHWGTNSPYTDRQDLSPNACAPCTGTISLPNPISTATEDAEWTSWQQKLTQSGLAVGVSGGTVATTAPTSTATPGSLTNPGFELDGAAVGTPTGWQTQTGTGTGDNADYTETYPGARTGLYHGTHYRPEAYEVYTYQTVSGLAAGTYTFRAWVKSSGGQPQAQLRARNYGGTALTATIPAAPSAWTVVEINNIAVTGGQCEIGFYSQASAGGQWLYFDDAELVRQNTPPTVALTASASLTLGQALALSAAAADADGTVSKVEFYSGTAKLGEALAAPYQLSWTPPAVGLYSLTARATDNGGATTTSAAVALAVVAPVVVVTTTPTTPTTTPVPGVNLAANPGFEADGAAVGAPAGWQTGAATASADFTEAYGGAHAGTYHGTHYASGSYEVYTYQTISGLAAGTYTVRAWVKSGGGQATAQLRASGYGGAQLTATIPATSGGRWLPIEINNIAVTSGQCEIGFYSQASGGQWVYFDDVVFTAQAATANTVLNASFEDDQATTINPSQWTAQALGTAPVAATFAEAYGGGHAGTYHGTHYATRAYEAYTHQTVSRLAAGTYTVRAWVKSGGGQATAQLRAGGYGGALASVAIPATGGQWVQVTLPGLVVSTGQCDIGFYSQAAAGQWLYFDDVELVKDSPSSGRAAATPAVAPTAPTAYPNPASDQTSITAEMAQAGKVLLVVVNAMGRPVAQHVRQATTGTNQFVIPTDTLPEGFYSVQIQSSAAATMLRLQVAH